MSAPAVGRIASTWSATPSAESVALRATAQRAENVATLSLISPALPDLRPRPGSWELLVALTPVLGSWIVRQALAGNPRRTARRVVRLCYGEPAGVTPQRFAMILDAVQRRARLPYSVAVYRHSLRGLVSAYLQRGRRGLWREAARVGVPTLLIYGGRDKLVDPRMAARALRAFPQARLVRLPTTGHVAQLERPDVVATELAQLFERARDANPARGMVSPRGTVVRSES